MFGEVSYEVLDEVIIGSKKKPGTYLQLVKTKKGNSRILCWHSIGKRWAVMYRHGDIEGVWASWKRIEKSINERKKNRAKPVGNSSKGKPKNKGTVSRTTKRSTKSSRVG
jgi:hypothetical protein